jgi:hypothetical protein
MAWDRMAYQRARRARFRAAGLCLDCGKARDSAYLRCQWCRTGNVIRVERSQYRRRSLGISFGRLTRSDCPAGIG